MLRYVISAVILLSVSACDKKDSGTYEQIVAGDLFPKVELTTLDGGRALFDRYHGKLVVLNIWATWCPPCRRELPSLERLQRSLDADDFAVVLLSVDNDDHVVREYLIDIGLELNSFIDRNGEISGKKLGVISYPVTYIISPQGRVMQVVYGEREWDNAEIVGKLKYALASGSISI